MGQLRKEILRMELQMGELIRMAANLNERLRVLEDRIGCQSYTQKIEVGKKVR